ncbi:3329_t:CDS:2, partial [Dentiscutata heterogama]
NEVAQGLIQEKSGCLVKFWYYVSEDLENCPYIYNRSRGYLRFNSKKINYPYVFLLSFRAASDSTSIQRFLKGVPLPELHPLLNNRSKIEHMIATSHHAEHPYGQDIMGVAYMLLKQKQNEKDNPYIRSI